MLVSAEGCLEPPLYWYRSLWKDLWSIQTYCNAYGSCRICI